MGWAPLILAGLGHEQLVSQLGPVGHFLTQFLILLEVELGFFMVVAELQEQLKKSKPQCASTFEVSAFVTFATVPSAKASHLAKPRVSVGGDYPRVWMQGATDGTITAIYTSHLPKLSIFLKI